MEQRTDIYGRVITLTIEGDEEVYTTPGIEIRFPLGAGWDRALDSFSTLAPASPAGEQVE